MIHVSFDLYIMSPFCSRIPWGPPRSVPSWRLAGSSWLQQWLFLGWGGLETALRIEASVLENVPTWDLSDVSRLSTRGPCAFWRVSTEFYSHHARGSCPGNRALLWVLGPNARWSACAKFSHSKVIFLHHISTLFRGKSLCGEMHEEWWLTPHGQEGECQTPGILLHGRPVSFPPCIYWILSSCRCGRTDT